MRGLRAILGKDLRLFHSAAGIGALLLPFLLLLALQAGGEGLNRHAIIKPFPIAIRDEDNTVMSRSLIGQMARISLFSKVMSPNTGESDQELLDRGAAAVVTIPKDFFYAMYSMDNRAVAVLLSGDAPLESAIFRSMFTSVLGIIGANQSSGRAVYRYCYGELSPELEERLWQENSVVLLADALGRQSVFDGEAEATDTEAAAARSFMGCTLAMLCLFFPLAVVRALPEEMANGILPRYLSAGGTAAAFFLSKFLSATLMATPSFLLLLLIFRPERLSMLVLLAITLLWGAFGLFLFVAAWSHDAESAQRRNNLVLIVSMTVGGALYARDLLPDWLQKLSLLTVPYYAKIGLEAIHHGAKIGAFLRVLWPVYLMGGCLTLLALPALRRGRRRSLFFSKIKAYSCPDEPTEGRIYGFASRLKGVSVIKGMTLSGGVAGLATLIVVAGLCGAVAVHALNRSEPEQLVLAIEMRDESQEAQELSRRLSEQSGVSLVQVVEGEGSRLLSNGRVEGLLIVGQGYGVSIREGGKLPLSYQSSASAVSAQAAREIIAGQALMQQARIRGILSAEFRLGTKLSEKEQEVLLELMDEEEVGLPPLFQVMRSGGEQAASQPAFSPNQMGFAMLLVMVVLLNCSSWMGQTDARRVEHRIKVVPRGRLLSYSSDVLTLFCSGLLIYTATQLPAGLPSLGEAVSMLAYVSCVTGLALTLVRLTALSSSKVDILAPFIALITSLLGGSFGNLGQFSARVQTLTCLTPQGLAMRGAMGSITAIFVLLAVSVILLFLGKPPRESRVCAKIVDL